MSNEVQTVSSSIAQMQVEIDTQISTAKKFPRDLALSEKNATTMIKSDKNLAASCSYSLSKGGSIITGPSIRLAEIIMSTWGNIRCAARINDQDAQWVYVQAFAHDLETNTRIEVETKRRITGKNGRTFSPDMIQTTAGAATSIAIRNALFKVIPYGYVNKLMGVAKHFALGAVDKEKQTQDAWLIHFEKLGVSRERVFEKFSVKNQTKMTVENWQTLVGISTAIRDGQTTVQNEFPVEQNEPPELTKEEKRTKIDTFIAKCNDEAEFEKVYKEIKGYFWFDKEADAIFHELFNKFLDAAASCPE